MKCESAEALLGQLVFGELDEAAANELREHLEQCETCRSLAGDMRVTIKLLKDGVEQDTPVLSQDRKAGLLDPETRQRLTGRGILAAVFTRKTAVFAAVAATLLLVALLPPALMTAGSSPYYQDSLASRDAPSAAFWSAATPEEPAMEVEEAETADYADDAMPQAPAKSEARGMRLKVKERVRGPAPGLPSVDKGFVQEKSRREAGPGRAVRNRALKKAQVVQTDRLEALTDGENATSPAAAQQQRVDLDGRALSANLGTGGRVAPREEMRLPQDIVAPDVAAPESTTSSVGIDNYNARVRPQIAAPVRRKRDEADRISAGTTVTSSITADTRQKARQALSQLLPGNGPAATHRRSVDRNNAAAPAAPPPSAQPRAPYRRPARKDMKLRRSAAKAGGVVADTGLGVADMPVDVTAVKRPVPEQESYVGQFHYSQPPQGRAVTRPDITQSPRWQSALDMIQGSSEQNVVATSGVTKSSPPDTQQYFVLSPREASVIEEQAAQNAIVIDQNLVEMYDADVADNQVEAGEQIATIDVDDDVPPPPVNPFVLTARDRLSTFAMDVDTASYSISRNYINTGSLPPRRLVRMEEFINAFDYNYPRTGLGTFNIHVQGMPSPFRQGLELVKIGIQAKVVGREERKSAHLVFVIDTSGSMELPDRLPLVQYALNLLVEQLDPRDTISIVTYGTTGQVLLEATPVSEVDTIRSTIENLQCTGSTNLFDGLRVGYQIARRNFRTGGINRIVLCSDGVANIGKTDAEQMLDQIAEFRDWGVTLTAAGFGAGTYSDQMLERLANNGDGNYVFIDSQREAKRVFVDQFAATIAMVAEDAKIQVDFNPSLVRRYRLIGYENRDIADKDFRNDAVDAGEVGSGHSVTALYELELEPETERSGQLGTVYVRYRNVDTGRVDEISRVLPRTAIRRTSITETPRLYLAAAVAEFAEQLRGSEHVQRASLLQAVRIIQTLSGQLPLDARVRELAVIARRALQIRGR